MIPGQKNPEEIEWKTRGWLSIEMLSQCAIIGAFCGALAGLCAFVYFSMTREWKVSYEFVQDENVEKFLQDRVKEECEIDIVRRAVDTKTEDAGLEIFTKCPKR